MDCAHRFRLLLCVSNPPFPTPSPTLQPQPPSTLLSINTQILSVQKAGVLFTTPDLRRLASVWEGHSAEYRVRFGVTVCVSVCVCVRVLIRSVCLSVCLSVSVCVCSHRSYALRAAPPLLLTNTTIRFTCDGNGWARRPTTAGAGLHRGAGRGSGPELRAAHAGMTHEHGWMRVHALHHTASPNYKPKFDTTRIHKDACTCCPHAARRINPPTTKPKQHTGGRPQCNINPPTAKPKQHTAI